MKLLKLETRNIASLEGDNVIDFEEGILGESQIFCIVGPTGSGKSTILDAICLALYGRTPRYPMVKGERNQRIDIIGEPDESESNRLAPTDPRNILTRGQKDCYCRLTFVAGDGQTYCAEWSVRFMRLKYGRAETRLVRLEGRDEVLCEWQDLESRIIGLDFDQFLRTVLIAQGSFANFLKAKDEERYELLEKLVAGGDIYKAIAAEVTARRDGADEAYQAISNQCGAYREQILTDDEAAAITAQIKELEAYQTQWDQEVKAVAEALRWYADDEGLIARRADAEQRRTAAATAWEAIRPQRDRLSLHDATLPAVAAYRAWLTATRLADECATQEKAVAEQMAQTEQQVVQAKGRQTVLEQKAKEAAAEWERQKPHINKARSLVAEVSAAEADARAKEKKVCAATVQKSKADRDVADHGVAIQKAETEYARAAQAVTVGEQTMTDRKAALQKAVETAARALEAQQSAIATLHAADLQAAVATTTRDGHDLADALRIRRSIGEKTEDMRQKKIRLTELKQRNETLARLTASLNLDTLRQDVEALTRTHTLMTSEDWARHRTLLTDGEPCPLCGARHHPYTEADTRQPALDALAEHLAKKRAALKEQEARLQSYTCEWQKNEGEWQSTTAALHGLTHEAARLAADWDAVAARHPDWPTDVTELAALQPSLDTAARAAAEALTTYNEKVKELDRLRRQKEMALLAQSRYADTSAQTAERLRHAEAAALTALETLRAGTATLVLRQKEKAAALVEAAQEWDKAKVILAKRRAQLTAEIGDKNPDTYETQLVRAVEDARAALDRQLADIQKLGQQLAAQQGALQALRQQREQHTGDRNRHAQTLRTWLADYNARPDRQALLAEEDIARLHAATDDWDTVRRDILCHREALTAAETTLRDATEVHLKHQASKPADPKETLETRSATLAAQSQWPALIDLQSRWRQHNAARAKMGHLAQRLTEATARRDDWNALYEAIGRRDGKDLRRMAGCYTLRFLVEYANAEIRKFNTRYELEQVRGSLAMRVVDHDRLDDRRDTTTLSGGETFIVSLGLALGLASLSSRGTRFSHLFIDEGFGTLDPDTLAVVIHALSLMQSSQGKKVGVISHTDTMSEQITAQIRVIKNGNSGTSHIDIGYRE